MYCDALRKCSSSGRFSRRESIRFATGPVAKANHATQESVCSSECGDNPSINIPHKGRKFSGARGSCQMADPKGGSRGQSA